MTQTSGTAQESGYSAEQELRNRDQSERIHRAAEEATELVPGRPAVRIEFTHRQVDALERILLDANREDDGSYFAHLESLGISYATWRYIFGKVHHAVTSLEKASSNEVDE